MAIKAGLRRARIDATKKVIGAVGIRLRGEGPHGTDDRVGDEDIHRGLIYATHYQRCMLNEAQFTPARIESYLRGEKYMHAYIAYAFTKEANSHLALAALNILSTAGEA